MHFTEVTFTNATNMNSENSLNLPLLILSAATSLFLAFSVLCTDLRAQPLKKNSSSDVLRAAIDSQKTLYSDNSNIYDIRSELLSPSFMLSTNRKVSLEYMSVIDGNDSKKESFLKRNKYLTIGIGVLTVSLVAILVGSSGNSTSKTEPAPLPLPEGRP